MIWLSNSTLARLRDQLRQRGARASIVSLDKTSSGDAELDAAVAEFGPLCDAMHLMMSADGEISVEEIEVLRGALRNLSGDDIRTPVIEELVKISQHRLEMEGREARLKDVVASLSEDTGRAEVAFVLAAAIAFADNAIADGENETLNAMAEGLGIDESRASTLMDDVEKDLALGPR